MAASGAAVLWAIFLVRNPYAPPAAGPTLLFGRLMIVASIIALLAAARGAHLAMYLLFVVCFVPVGFYAMLGPGVFQAIGWLNLAYLAAAWLVHRGVQRKTRGMAPRS